MILPGTRLTASLDRGFVPHRLQALEGVFGLFPLELPVGLIVVCVNGREKGGGEAKVVNNDSSLSMRPVAGARACAGGRRLRARVQARVQARGVVQLCMRQCWSTFGAPCDDFRVVRKDCTNVAEHSSPGGVPSNVARNVARGFCANPAAFEGMSQELYIFLLWAEPYGIVQRHRSSPRLRGLPSLVGNIWATLLGNMFSQLASNLCGNP